MASAPPQAAPTLGPAKASANAALAAPVSARRHQTTPASASMEILLVLGSLIATPVLTVHLEACVRLALAALGMSVSRVILAVGLTCRSSCSRGMR